MNKGLRPRRTAATPGRPTAWLRILPLCLSAAIGSYLAPTRAEVDASAKAAPQQRLVSMAVSLINKDRAQNGSGPVQPDESLSQLAQTYAEYILKTGHFAHIDPYGRSPQDRAQYCGIRQPVAENLAYQYSNFENHSVLVHRAQSEMMNEPPNQRNHRSNILDPRHRYVGVGVATTADTVIVVHEFTDGKP